VTKNLIGIALLSLFAGTATAGPSTFAEFGYITGGENGENGSGSEDGVEIAGAFKITDIWYVAGSLGHYERDFTGGGDIENDYLNIAGGVAIGLNDKTDFIGEIGVWAGEQDRDGGEGGSTDPLAIEFKTGVSHAVTDKFSLGGTISLVAGDTDQPGNSDLTNFVWSAGGAYAFTPNLSLNLKLVEGSNGVNGQSDVVRIGARWTF
jgi:hypothetical protein